MLQQHQQEINKPKEFIQGTVIESGSLQWIEKHTYALEAYIYLNIVCISGVDSDSIQPIINTALDSSMEQWHGKCCSERWSKTFKGESRTARCDLVTRRNFTRFRTWMSAYLNPALHCTREFEIFYCRHLSVS